MVGERIRSRMVSLSGGVGRPGVQGSGWRTVLLPPAAAGDAWAGAAVHLLLLDAGAGAQVALAAARALQQAAGWGGSAADARAAEPAGLVMACVGRAAGGSGASSAGEAVGEVAWWAEVCVLLRQELQLIGAAQVVEEPLLLLARPDEWGGAEEAGAAEAEVVRQPNPPEGAGSEAEAAPPPGRRRAAVSAGGGAVGWAAGMVALVGALRAAVEERNKRLAERAALVAA